MKKNKVKGYTLIEVLTTLVIASIVSIGMYSVFTKATNDIKNETVMLDTKNYASNALKEISEDMRRADNIDCDKIGDFTTINIDAISIDSSGQEEVETIRYYQNGNLIYRYSSIDGTRPLHIYGDRWLKNDQEFWDLGLLLTCVEKPTDASPSEVRDFTYDVIIDINIQSKTDLNYRNHYKAYRRVFAFNKFVIEKASRFKLENITKDLYFSHR